MRRYKSVERQVDAIQLKNSVDDVVKWLEDFNLVFDVIVKVDGEKYVAKTKESRFFIEPSIIVTMNYGDYLVLEWDDLVVMTAEYFRARYDPVVDGDKS